MRNGLLVLVVDAERKLRRFLRASLVSHGFRFLEAGTAEDALTAARTNSPEPCLLGTRARY